MTKKIIIAIDGHSSCGKSTMAKALAKKINYTYIDSGAMYRAVTLYAMKNNLISDQVVNELKLKDEMKNIQIYFKYNEINQRSETYLNDVNVEDEIRNIDVSNYVSLISKIGFVREEMVDQQRKMGEEKGIIMDGRDIATVVFPNADLKVFVTANEDVRAMRRYKELSEKGENVTFDEVKQNIQKRDYIDQNREIAPLKQAEGAVVLDNSNLSHEEQLNWLVEKVMQIVN